MFSRKVPSTAADPPVKLTVPVPDINTDIFSLPSVNGEPDASTSVPVLFNVRSEEYLNITTPEPPLGYTAVGLHSDPPYLPPDAPPPVFTVPSFGVALVELGLSAPPPRPPVPPEAELPLLPPPPPP